MGHPEKKQLFEWQKSSLFSPPLGTWHRPGNQLPGQGRARLRVGTNAPPIMEMYRSRQFIFDNPFQFHDRYPEDENYFKPAEKLGIKPQNGRHINLGNLIPDTMNCELPLENHRGAGHRNFSWKLAGNFSFGFVAQYPPGRYSKAHYHPGGPVLVCLRGKGYLLTWPRELGIRPWGKWQWPSGSAPGLRRVGRGQRSARHRQLVSRPFRRLQRAFPSPGFSRRLPTRFGWRSRRSSRVQRRPEAGRELNRIPR